jgi:uncharacterized protein YcbX
MRTGLSRDIPVDEPSGPSHQSSPQDGDVVVAREAQSRVHYTVRQLPGTVQISANGREQAERLARRFGREFSVDVWYREGSTYRLLEANRPQAFTPARLRRKGGLVAKPQGVARRANRSPG